MTDPPIVVTKLMRKTRIVEKPVNLSLMQRHLQRKKFNVSIITVIFNAALIRVVSLIKITLLLKKQWKQHRILYLKIVSKHNMTC
jgi:hypothetical protein